MTEWREVPIGSVILEFHDGPHATPKPSASGPVYLGIKNLTDDGHLDLTDTRHISESDYERWTRRVTPLPDDIVFTYEATLHRYGRIPIGFRGCLGRRLALIRPDASKVDPRFLHLSMLGPEWRAQAETKTIRGSTVDRLPIIGFPDFLIRLPDLGSQRRIADVLTAFDELIENNRRRIEILEETTRSLYREWFVRFRFPGHEFAGVTDSSLGSKPIGWALRPFGELCRSVTTSVDPRNVDPDLPAVGLEHLPRRSTTLRDWARAESLGSRKLCFEPGDVLFGKIRPYFHKVVMAPMHGVCSTDAIVLRPNDDLIGLVLAVAASDEFVAHAVQTSNGTKMPRANWTVLAGYPVAIPEEAMARQFSDDVATLARSASALAMKNRTLATARDLLLPRLVTGAIDVDSLGVDDVFGWSELATEAASTSP